MPTIQTDSVKVGLYLATPLSHYLIVITLVSQRLVLNTFIAKLHDCNEFVYIALYFHLTVY